MHEDGWGGLRGSTSVQDEGRRNGQREDGDTATTQAAAGPRASSGVGMVLQSLFWLEATTVPATGCALPLGRGHELGQGRAIPREGLG